MRYLADRVQFYPKIKKPNTYIRFGQIKKKYVQRGRKNNNARPYVYIKLSSLYLTLKKHVQNNNGRLSVFRVNPVLSVSHKSIYSFSADTKLVYVGYIHRWTTIKFFMHLRSSFSSLIESNFRNFGRPSTVSNNFGTNFFPFLYTYRCSIISL